MTNVYSFDAKMWDGTSMSLSRLRGSISLIVNTASHCGFTPQLAEIEELYARYRMQGFVVLGFPCNQFGAQSPGSDAELQQVCSTRYAVTFPMFANVRVNGPDAHPLFRYLTQRAPGVLDTHFIKWHFTKFLVDKTGEVAGRYAPRKRPGALTARLDRLLRA